MRALLSLCVPLLVLAGSGCQATAGPRAASRMPVAKTEAAQRPAPAAVHTEPSSRSPRVPTVDVLASVPPPADTPTAQPLDDADELDGEVHGTIVARTGSRVTIRLDDETPIATGDRAQLLRHFERRLGSATLTGWLDVARVTVIARDGRAFDLSIDEETARVMVNGRKQDQFRVGFRVRLQAT